MSKFKYEPLIPLLADLLDYNPATGALTWSHKTIGRRIKGNLAGSIAADGNRYIKQNRLNVPYAKVCLFKATGQIAEHVIHLNGDDTDFRLTNIAPAPSAMIYLMRDKNTSSNLPKGITKTPSGRFSTRYSHNGRSYRAGTYDTVEQAVVARERSLQRLISTL